MGDWQPVIMFATLLVVVNVVLLAWFSAFELDITDFDTYDDNGTITNVNNFLENSYNLTFIGGYIEATTDWIPDLLTIWSIIPSKVIWVLLVPIFIGFVYALIKALPTT